MWKRNYFFLMDKLQITPGERRIIIGIIAFVLAIHVYTFAFPPSGIYDDAYYEPVISEFKRLSGEKSRERNIVLARYYPDGLPVLSKAGIRTDPFFRWAGSGRTSPGYTDIETEEPHIGRLSTHQDKIEDVQEARINIQTAGVNELVRLPGIGPVTAERIVTYREEHGPFTSVEDLLQISGIGPVTMERIRGRVYVE
ncbi:helix-hairpin-helix domain-containing protein [Balneolaceae bacterium ANBcel3]|nr:helix-hairpin-helix domain-containing protein [Balneolaceae bacterium ANBcel3]